MSESCSSAVARLRNDLYCVEWGVQLYSNQPTNPQLLQRERQTDGRTDARQLHRPCSAYYTGSVNNPPSPIHCWLVHVGGNARVCDLTAWNCQELNSTNKSVLTASFVGSQHDATRTGCWTPAPAARRPQLSIDICCPQGAQQQTRRPRLLLSIDGTDKWKDRRTDARPSHRPCSSYHTGSVNN